MEGGNGAKARSGGWGGCKENGDGRQDSGITRGEEGYKQQVRSGQETDYGSGRAPGRWEGKEKAKRDRIEWNDDMCHRDPSSRSNNPSDGSLLL